MASDSQPPKRDVTATMGQVIDGRYKITAFIGDGGMGSVYRAEHVTIRRPLALKLLHRRLAAQPGFAERFEREALAAGRIDHPNCVEVSDFGRLGDGTLYLVMELAQGRVLGDVLAEEKRFAPARALHIARHALRGLGHAHEAGIVHRDIKPDNIILVDQDGDPDYAKILDFGIAKLVGEAASEVASANLTQVGTAIGTPRYMPPEQAFGKNVDARADLYSLSVVLYLMLTGRTPFEAEDVLDLLMHHASRPPPSFAEAAPGAHIPPFVEALVMRGLAKKPADRYASASAYLAAIDDAMSRLSRPNTMSGAAPAATGTMPAATGTMPAATGTMPAATGTMPTATGTMPTAIPTSATMAVSAPHPPLWQRLTVQQWLLGGAFLALAIVAISAATFSDGAVDTTDHGKHLSAAVDLLQTGARAVNGNNPSELATRAAALNRDHRYRDVLELTDKKELDGYAHLERGHALFELERQGEGMAEYRTALADSPALRGNERVLRRARELVGSRDLDTDLAATEVRIRYAADDEARAHLIEMAGENKVLDQRRRARELAFELGMTADVDRVHSYALDLMQEKTCAKRHEALLQLGRLGDARALPAVQRARRRMRGGLLGVGDKNTNACLAADAKRIAEQLRAE